MSPVVLLERERVFEVRCDLCNNGFRVGRDSFFSSNQNDPMLCAARVGWTIEAGRLICTRCQEEATVPTNKPNLLDVAADILEEKGYGEIAENLREAESNIVGYIIRNKKDKKPSRGSYYNPGVKLYAKKHIAEGALKNSDRNQKTHEIVPVYVFD